MTNLKEEIPHLVNWTKKYFLNSGMTKAIIGISGGIDSAVTADICAKALGKENVIGIILPCDSIYQDAIDARTVCHHLDIPHSLMDLENVYRLWWNEFRSNIAAPGIEAGVLPDINKLIPANAKARLRMLTLYGVAGQANGLVVGTTNKTEAVLGYATKYGDGGVDIEPIMDFYKTEVFEMAKILQIPEVVINKAPSAGLWMGQTDESELGASYELIDGILKHRKNRILSPTEDENYTTEMDRIEQLIATNKHKDLGLPHYKKGK